MIEGPTRSRTHVFALTADDGSVTSDQGQTRVRKALNQSRQDMRIGIQNIIFIDGHDLFALLVMVNYLSPSLHGS